MNTLLLKRAIAVLLLGFCFLAVSRTAHAAPTLEVGSAKGTPGSSVSIPVIFNRGTSSISGIQFNLTLPPGLSSGTVTGGDILAAAGKTASSNLRGSTWTFIVFGLDQNTIGKGTLLTVQLKIAPGTKLGTLKLPISGVVYTDPKGQTIAAGKNVAGKVVVASSAS